MLTRFLSSMAGGRAGVLESEKQYVRRTGSWREGGRTGWRIGDRRRGSHPFAEGCEVMKDGWMWRCRVRSGVVVGGAGEGEEGRVVEGRM